MNQTRIEIPLLKAGLPLSLASNLLALSSIFPTLVLIYFLRDFKFIQEGGWLLLVILALLDYGFVRYAFAKKEHPEIVPIVYENQAFIFPANLFQDKKPFELKLSAIKEAVIYESASVRGRATWKMRLSDSLDRQIVLKIFWTDLKQIEKILAENNIQITKKIVPIFMWFYGIMFTVGIGILIWAFYFREV